MERGAIDPKDVVRFVEQAKPGESEVYAWGKDRGDFPRTLPGVKKAQALHRAGLLTFTTRKVSPGRVDYVMQAVARREREARKLPKAPVRADESSLDRAIKIAMQMLRRAAHAKVPQPCPTDDEIEDRFLEVGITLAASYVMRKLRLDGRITSKCVGKFQRRVVTIVSSGRSTAMANP